VQSRISGAVGMRMTWQSRRRAGVGWSGSCGTLGCPESHGEPRAPRQSGCDHARGKVAARTQVTVDAEIHDRFARRLKAARNAGCFPRPTVRAPIGADTCSSALKMHRSTRACAPADWSFLDLMPFRESRRVNRNPEDTCFPPGRRRNPSPPVWRSTRGHELMYPRGSVSRMFGNSPVPPMSPELDQAACGCGMFGEHQRQRIGRPGQLSDQRRQRVGAVPVRRTGAG